MTKLYEVEMNSKGMPNFSTAKEVPERKTGKWIYHPDWETDGECGYECSECGMGSDVNYNYCPKCGAKMYGGDANV